MNGIEDEDLAWISSPVGWSTSVVAYLRGGRSAQERELCQVAQDIGAALQMMLSPNERPPPAY